MRLIVVNERCPSELGRLWWDAIRDVQIRHWIGTVECVLDVNAAVLSLSVLGALDTLDMRTPKPHLAIGSVQLSCWPGVERARQWLAAAWCGYQMHEALEMVTLDGRAVWDPHAPPYPLAPANRPIVDAMPRELTAEALERALAVVTGSPPR